MLLFECRNMLRTRTRQLCVVLLMLVAVLFLLAGCTKETTEEKLSDVDYTIVKEADIPQELKTIIESKKAGEFKLTYANEQELYLVVGYGQQTTSGYSIQVEEVYLTKDNLVVKTSLLGPETKAAVQLTYPYVVIKTEFREEPVLFL